MKKIILSVLVLGLFFIGVAPANAAGLTCTTTHPAPNSTVTVCTGGSTTTTNQSNTTVISNNVVVVANTGGNVSNGGSITTGNATARVRIVNRVH